MLPPEFMMNGMMGMGGPIMPPRPPPGAPPPAASQPGEPLDPRQTPAQSPAYGVPPSPLCVSFSDWLCVLSCSLQSFWTPESLNVSVIQFCCTTCRPERMDNYKCYDSFA